MRSITLNIVKYLTLLMFLVSCSVPHIKAKTAPEYQGVDPRAQKLVDEYMSLSKLNRIKFYNKVTIGFKTLNDGNAVGMCTYGLTFREIDVDVNYWNNSTKLTHLTLLFHELTHCYCSRGHDYGLSLDYPETNEQRIKRAMQWLAEGGARPGYWDDGCPISFMYPVVLDDECVKNHYQEYVNEMFDRCEAW